MLQFMTQEAFLAEGKKSSLWHRGRDPKRDVTRNQRPSSRCVKETPGSPGPDARRRGARGGQAGLERPEFPFGFFPRFSHHRMNHTKMDFVEHL